MPTRIETILGDARTQKLTREASVERNAINAEKRTVELSFASESPVERWFGREILDMRAEAMDRSRMDNKAALLLNHDWEKQIGVVEKAWVDDTTKKARAVVRFSRSALGEEIFRDVQDGIRTLISVGYIIRKMVLESVEDDVETHRATDWQPFEISVVPVPADPSVGVGRSQPDAIAPQIRVAQPQNSIPKMDTPVPNAPDQTAVERARVKEINTTCDQIVSRHAPHADAVRAMARKCIETGDNVDAFTRGVLTSVLNTEPIAPTRQAGAEIGMAPKDVQRYSILRAIRNVINNKPIDGLERECSDELTKKLGRQPTGFFLPDDVVIDAYAKRREQRVMYAGVPSAGGYTVGQELMASEFVEYLRANTRVVELGGRYIGGLVGDVTIPQQLTGATVYWVSETGSITASNATFGQIVARPRRIGTSVPYTKQFLAQTSLGAEAFVVNDSDASIAVDLDRVALRGIGGAEPLGIYNMASGDRSTSVTFGAAPTWAKYLEFFANVAANNAIVGQPAFLASVASAVKAMTIAKFSTGTSDPIWENDKVGVFRALWTTQLLTSATPVANGVIFGDFSQCLFLEWAGRDVVVDPYSSATSGQVIVTIQRLMDHVVRRGKSFAVSSDSGAQ